MHIHLALDSESHVGPSVTDACPQPLPIKSLCFFTLLPGASWAPCIVTTTLSESLFCHIQESSGHLAVAISASKLPPWVRGPLCVSVNSVNGWIGKVTWVLDLGQAVPCDIHWQVLMVFSSTENGPKPHSVILSISQADQHLQTLRPEECSRSQQGIKEKSLIISLWTGWSNMGRR